MSQSVLSPLFESATSAEDLKSIIIPILFTKDNKFNVNISRTISRNCPKALKLIESLTPKLLTECSIAERIFWIINDLKEYPKKCYCGKSITFFKSFGYGHRDICSCKCKANDKKLREKVQALNLERYGWKAFNHTKGRKTCLKRYGVENAGFLAVFSNNKGNWKNKILPSGKEIKCQGYEPQAIDLLLNEFSEEEIIFRRKFIPKISYFLDGKNHLYFPDLFIPKENLLIEVKSHYTFEYDLKKNEAKIKYSLNSGFNLRLIIFENNGIDIKLDKWYRNTSNQST